MSEITIKYNEVVIKYNAKKANMLVISSKSVKVFGMITKKIC